MQQEITGLSDHIAFNAAGRGAAETLIVSCLHARVKLAHMPCSDKAWTHWQKRGRMKHLYMELHAWVYAVWVMPVIVVQ